MYCNTLYFKGSFPRISLSIDDGLPWRERPRDRGMGAGLSAFRRLSALSLGYEPAEVDDNDVLFRLILMDEVGLLPWMIRSWTC